jgi:hypothetical protein
MTGRVVFTEGIEFVREAVAAGDIGKRKLGRPRYRWEDNT